MRHIGKCDRCGHYGQVDHHDLLGEDVCMSCWNKIVAANMRTQAKVTKAGDSNFKGGEIVPIGDFALMVKAILEEGGEHPIATPLP